MRADFSMKFYTTVKQYTLLQSCVKMHLEMTKLCYFNEEPPSLQFLSVSSVMQNLLPANSLEFVETPVETLRWTITILLLL